MNSLPDDSEIHVLRDQLADARSLALQFQRELEKARAELESARQELWKAHHRLTAKESRGAEKRSGVRRAV